MSDDPESAEQYHKSATLELIHTISGPSGRGLGYPFTGSVAGSLVLLTLAVLVPLLLVQISIYYGWFETQRDNEYRSNLELARSVATAFDAQMKDVLHHEMSIGLAFSASHPPSPEEAVQILGRDVGEYPSISSFNWVSPQGRVVASNSQYMAGIDLSGRIYFQQIALGQDSMVSDLFDTGPLQSPTFTISRAVRDNDGRLLGLVVGVADIERLSEALPVSRAQRGSIAIIDRQARLVYHFPDIPLTWKQRNMLTPRPIVAVALAGKEATGIAASISSQGDRMTSVVPIQSIGWVAWADRPIDEVMGPITSGLLRDSGLLLLVALLGILAARRLSLNITVPLGRLREHALSVGQGELERPITLNGPREMEELAEAFKRMSAEIGLREQQRDELFEKLMKSEAQFRTIFESAAIGITLADLEGHTIQRNPAARRMLGYAPDTPLESSIWDIAHPEEVHREKELFQEMVAGRRNKYQIEKRFLRSDGTYIWGRVTSSVVRDGEGRPQFAFGMVEDITERKRLEEQLLRAQRLETAGRIAGQVAHDFNNLLGPLVGYPDLIKARLPQDHPAQQYCDLMTEAAERMAAINEDMLAFGRRGHFDQQPTDLNLIVKQIVEELADKPANLTLNLELAPDLLAANGSPVQLMRVVANLLSNAREAMLDSGLLTLRTENVYVDEPFGQYNQVEVGEYVRLTMVDTGCGIPLEIRDKIFDAFFTTKVSSKRRGSGLGLSIVQAVVEDHQGYLDLETAVGKGTTFTIYLPASRQAVGACRQAGVPRGNEAVLVVDDDQLQREVTRELLQELGYRVDTVAGGEQAIEYLRDHQVDLILLDMIMPPGIDGAETYRRILKIRPGQRAIIVSGFAESEQVKAAQALGAGDYIRKPLTLENLARAIRRELDQEGDISL